MKRIFFTIVLILSIQFANAQTINLIFPNGGEHFMNNTQSPNNITWDASGVTSFKIEYSLNGGTDWVLIEDNYSVGNFYSWDVPDVLSSNCIIRVSDAGGSVFDESDAIFNIVTQGIYIAEWNTTMGQIRAELRGNLVPVTAQNFMNLTEKEFYTDLIFHRVISGFMIQDGCPYGNGTGGPGYEFDDEFTPELRHSFPGVLSMANAGPNTNGSQYFITVAQTSWLDDHYSVFGRVIDGMDVVYAISEAETDGNDKPLTDIGLTISLVENNPSLNILYPSDGLKIEAGRTIDINWESDFVADVKIEFSSDNGSNWTELKDSIPSDNEKYTWTAPDIIASQCLIKITSLRDGSIYTQNSIPFEIRENPAELKRFELYEGVSAPDNNPENIVMLNKNLRFRINVENFAGIDLNSVNVNMVCNDDNLNIITSDIVLNTIANGGNLWSDEEFEIQLPENYPADGQYIFSLYGTAANVEDEFWLGDFTIPVLKKFPFMTVDDDNSGNSSGNGNGILEPGETIETEPKIDNSGDETLYDVYGQLTSHLNFINIWNNVNGFDGMVYDTAAYNNGLINPHAAGQIPSHDFVFDYNADDIYITNFILKINGFLNETEGASWDEGGIKIIWGIPVELNASYPPAALKDLSKENVNFTIMPNPTSDFISVAYDFSHLNQPNISVELKNIQGKTVLREQLINLKGTIIIHVSSLSQGIYFVKINNRMKKVVILK